MTTSTRVHYATYGGGTEIPCFLQRHIQRVAWFMTDFSLPSHMQMSTKCRERTTKHTPNRGRVVTSSTGSQVQNGAEVAQLIAWQRRSGIQGKSTSSRQMQGRARRVGKEKTTLGKGDHAKTGALARAAMGATKAMLVPKCGRIAQQEQIRPAPREQAVHCGDSTSPAVLASYRLPQFLAGSLPLVSVRARRAPARYRGQC